MNTAATSPAEPAAKTPAPAEPAKPDAATAPAPTAEPAKPTDGQEKIAQRLAKTKAREAQIAAKKKELEAQIEQAKQFQELKSGGAKNAKKVLELLGITYDQLTNALLDDADPSSAAVKEVHDKIAQLEKQIKDKDEAAAAAAKEKEEQDFTRAATEYEGSVKNFLDTNSDKYEIAHKSNASSLVRKVVVEYYHTHKKMLSMEEACDLVEAHLEKQLKNFAGSKKLKSWLQENTEDKGNNTTTLTNDNSRSASAPTQSDKLTRDERLRRALLKLEGKI